MKTMRSPFSFVCVCVCVFVCVCVLCTCVVLAGNRLSVAAWQAVKDKLKQRCLPDPANKNRLPVCCYDPDGNPRARDIPLFLCLIILSFYCAVYLDESESCHRKYHKPSAATIPARARSLLFSIILRLLFVLLYCMCRIPFI